MSSASCPRAGRHAPASHCAKRSAKRKLDFSSPRRAYIFPGYNFRPEPATAITFRRKLPESQPPQEPEFFSRNCLTTGSGYARLLVLLPRSAFPPARSREAVSTRRGREEGRQETMNAEVGTMNLLLLFIAHPSSFIVNWQRRKLLPH